MKYARKEVRDLVVNDIFQRNVASAKDLSEQWFQVTSVEVQGNDTVVSAKPVQFLYGHKIEQEGETNDKLISRMVVVTVKK